MIEKIEYEDKVAIQNDETVPEKSKVTDNNLNEIKRVVNNNADELTTANGNIANIQKEQKTQGNNLTNLQKSVNTNTKNIETNAKSIENNTKSIEINAKNIETNTKKIDTNTTAIKENTKDIRTNADAIELNASDIKDLQAENTALKEELEKQKEDAKLNGLTEDNEGELIHITDATGARFNSIEIQGNQKQETRDGKNLYNVRDTAGQNFNSTLKVNEDDVISLQDYTNTGSATQWLDFRTNPESKLQANKLYYIVTEIFSVSGQGLLGVITTNADAMGQFKNGVSYNFEDLQAGDIKVATATTREDLSACLTETRSYVQMKVSETGSISFRISILENEVTAENFIYEKYGASPSFNYPSEIKAVGDDINLFNNIKTIVGSVDNATSKIIASNSSRLFVSECEPNQTYTISKNIKTDTARFRIDCSAELPDVGSIVTKLLFDSSKTQATVTTTSNAKYLILTMCDEATNESVPLEEVLKNIKVQKGNLVTAQSPYGQGSASIIVCNKNFLKITAENQTVNGINLEINGNKVKMNGTAEKDFTLYLAKDFYLPAKNMFVSFKEEGSVNTVNSAYSLRNADNKQLIGNNKIGSPTNKYISADDLGNTMKLFAFWITQGTVFTNFAVEIQIEAGASATDIVANEQQEHVVPVQQKMFSKDKFDLKKKKEVHSMKKIVLDGVYYVWGVKAIGSGSVVQFGINLGFTAKENPLAISNYFKKETNYSVVNTFVIASNLKTAYFHIPADSIEEVSTTTLQKKLKELYDAGNPVELWVEAEEPDELDLTEEQIAVLEQIEQATTYKEVTNVYTTDEIGAIIKTNTNVDLKSVINNVVETQLSQIGG